MCLFPKLLPNPRYQPNKKNGGIPPVCEDIRMRYIPVGCGKCMECRKQKARQWQVRLNEEIKVNRGYFVTLTFREERLREYYTKYKECKSDNDVPTKAVRLFLERWRLRYKRGQTNVKLIKHWLITEKGHKGTKRIHLHGILFTDKPINNEYLKSMWEEGMVFVGTFCNEQTINYIVKYVTKLDTENKGFEGKILCSKGIGANYINESTKYMHQYQQGQTREEYRLKSGIKINMPIYYRNKLYSEEERMKLWCEKIDKKKRYVNGIEIDISTKQGEQRYLRVLKTQQEINNSLGYGNDSWNKKNYLKANQLINKKKRKKRKFFAKKFAYMKNKYYLCSVKQKQTKQ